MIKVQLYGKQDCHLCLVAKETLFRVREHIPFEFQEIDIESGKDLYADFREKIPVVFIDGKRTFTHEQSDEESRSYLVYFNPEKRFFAPRGRSE